jgi:hypothetical protein
MQIDWAARVRKTNRELLVTIGFLYAAYFAVFGFQASDIRFAASGLWLMYFIAVQLRWKADPRGGGVAVRRELIRQGRLFKRAWAWFALPSLLGVNLGFRWSLALVVALTVYCTVRLWRTGNELIRRAND